MTDSSPRTATAAEAGSAIPAALPLAVLAGALLARALTSLHPTLCCDSQGYYDLSQALIRDGLGALAGNIRTYGYPAFLAVLSGWRARPIEWVHAAAAAVQGAGIGLAAVLANRMARRLGATRRAAAAVGACVLLNPVLLARASEMLTDCVAALLLFGALLPAIPFDSPRRLPLRAGASLLAASAAAAVRPANVIFLGAAALYWLIRSAAASRASIGRTAAAVLLAAAIPLLPQILLNNRYVGTPKPFLMASDYPNQTVWGMRWLKFAGFISPGQSPYLLCPNPFFDRAWDSPREFVRHSPAGYAATLALHAFTLTDQDALFTYITDRTPWHRWPVSLASSAWLFVALLGAACAVGRRGPCRADAALRGAGLASAALCALCIGFYAPTLVESRFSTPVYLLGLPLILIGLRLLAALLARRARTPLVRVALAGVVFLASSSWLSAWIQRHSALQPGRPQVMTLPPLSP